MCSSELRAEELTSVSKTPEDKEKELIFSEIKNNNNNINKQIEGLGWLWRLLLKTAISFFGP